MADSIHDLPPFPGFPETGLAFLRALADNNDRDWFEAHRERYETDVRFPLKCLIADVARRMRTREDPLTGHPNTSRFRIYRDLRFTDDPRPYKTNVGAVFDRSGRKDAPGVVYVHVEPGAAFLAGGFYQPSVSYLKPIRRAMADDPQRFHRMRAAMDEQGVPVTSMGDTLTGMPRGFHDERERDVAAYLKWKHLVAERPLDDRTLMTPKLTQHVLQMAADCRPLFDYVWPLESEDTA